ncbi:MAG: SxtJ family membrane protein [Myxococcota bacterium]
MPSERSFGLTIGILLAVIGLFPLWRGAQPVTWLLVVAAALVALALVYPRALAGPNRAWTLFGHYAGRVTNPLLLGLVYFLIMTPMSLALRLTGRDPLGLRFRRGVASYWQAPKPSEQPLQQSMRRQF